MCCIDIAAFFKKHKELETAEELKSRHHDQVQPEDEVRPEWDLQAMFEGSVHGRHIDDRCQSPYPKSQRQSSQPIGEAKHPAYADDKLRISETHPFSMRNIPEQGKRQGEDRASEETHDARQDEWVHIIADEHEDECSRDKNIDQRVGYYLVLDVIDSYDHQNTKDEKLKRSDDARDKSDRRIEKEYDDEKRAGKELDERILP